MMIHSMLESPVLEGGSPPSKAAGAAISVSSESGQPPLFFMPGHNYLPHR